MASFPTIHNGATPYIKDGYVSFSYSTSRGKIVTERKELLDSNQIKDRVIARLERFRKAGLGSRESEHSRAERKFISTHPKDTLKEAFNSLDDHGKMEFSMMFDMNSHFGHSSLKWLSDNVERRETIIGDNDSPLDKPIDRATSRPSIPKKKLAIDPSDSFYKR